MSCDDVTPSLRYREGVTGHRWESDPAQLGVLPEFDRMHAALCQKQDNGFFGKIKTLLGETRGPVQGLYLWGSVGRGKTFLMDMFVASLPRGLVLRRHFHRFMGETHEAMRALGERADPLVEVAAGIAAKARVLCLDEFLVNDIGDAMILANLLDALFARGVTLVATSNVPPAELYKDGLQRERFLPAIDLLQSSSKMATPGIVGNRHYAVAQQIRRTLAQYEELKDVIAMLGLEQLSPEDRKAVARARRLERFLTQPFFATEQFTGIKGKLVSLGDSLDGCERILADEFKDYPESALYMIGAIGEARQRNATPERPGAPAHES